MALNDGAQEFLTLEYAGGSKLYVPVANMHLISRYSGADEALAAPAPPGLGAVGEGPTQGRGKGPGRRRGASRYLCAPGAPTGPRLPGPGRGLQRFAGAFPFEETDDQERAIAAVLEDMTAARAMDRLVCGDVGFGKRVALAMTYLANGRGAPGRRARAHHPPRPTAL